MKVIQLYAVGHLANTYLLTENGVDAVAVDASHPLVLEKAKRYGLTVRYVLLTHGHFDHIAGAGTLQRAGAKVGCLQTETSLIAGEGNLAGLFGETLDPFTVDFTFQGGEELELCGMKLKVIATPGHTAGSCCFLAENHLFTGDTILANVVGRTDFPTGSAAELERSVKKLYALEGDYILHAGHEDDSTLEYERKHNGAIRA